VTDAHGRHSISVDTHGTSLQADERL